MPFWQCKGAMLCWNRLQLRGLQDPFVLLDLCKRTDQKKCE